MENSRFVGVLVPKPDEARVFSGLVMFTGLTFPSLAPSPAQFSVLIDLISR